MCCSPASSSLCANAEAATMQAAVLLPGNAGKVVLTVLSMQAASIRQTCSAALVAFLLDYPLGPRRVQAHFTFLLSNVQVRIGHSLVLVS